MLGLVLSAMQAKPKLLNIFLSEQYTQPSSDAIRVLRGHQLSVTCLCLSPEDKFVFSGSKDCSIIKCKYLTVTFSFLPLKHGKNIHGPYQAFK